jgi:ATP-dependent Lhr-like helicase
VKQAGGLPPTFSGGLSSVLGRVRQKMHEMLSRDTVPAYLDKNAVRLLNQARKEFSQLELNRKLAVDLGDTIIFGVWESDATLGGLEVLLRWLGIETNRTGPIVEFRKAALGAVEVQDLLDDMGRANLPGLEVLLAESANLEREKWDGFVPLELLQASLAGREIDIAMPQAWAAKASKQL